MPPAATLMPPFFHAAYSLFATAQSFTGLIFHLHYHFALACLSPSTPSPDGPPFADACHFRPPPVCHVVIAATVICFFFPCRCPPARVPCLFTLPFIIAIISFDAALIRHTPLSPTLYCHASPRFRLIFFACRHA